MTFLVGLLDFIGLLLWTCLMIFLYAAGGGHPWDPTTLFLYCGPLAYFVLSLVSTLPGTRSQSMAILGIVANLALLPFLGISLSHGAEGLIFALPFLALDGLWYLAYRGRTRAVRSIPPSSDDAPAVPPPP